MLPAQPEVARWSSHPALPRPRTCRLASPPRSPPNRCHGRWSRQRAADHRDPRRYFFLLPDRRRSPWSPYPDFAVRFALRRRSWLRDFPTSSDSLNRPLAVRLTYRLSRPVSINSRRYELRFLAPFFAITATPSRPSRLSTPRARLTGSLRSVFSCGTEMN
jgi:hypothetical protein